MPAPLMLVMDNLHDLRTAVAVIRIQGGCLYVSGSVFDGHVGQARGGLDPV